MEKKIKRTKQPNKFSISNIESTIEDYGELKINNKVNNILLSLIFVFTGLDLILFITQSKLLVLYIPIMLIVFVLLAIFNSHNNSQLIFTKDKILFKSNRKIKTIKQSKIKEIKNKGKKITIELDKNSQVSFSSSQHKIIFDKLRDIITE